MTFDAFLTLDRPRSNRWRRLTYVLSLALHGALLVVGVAASFWRVEEVSANVQIPVYMGAFTPPPPPPPPAGKTRPTPRPRTRTAVLVQPRPTQVPTPVEPTHEEIEGPPGDPTDTGNDPNSIGPPGDPCSVGPCDGPSTRFLAPHVAQAQLAIDPHADPYRVHLPPALASARISVWALVKICVKASGEVESASILESSEASLDATIVSVMRGWRYRPFTLDGRPVPFCSNVRYQITAL